MSLRMLWSLLTIFLVATVAVVMMVSIAHIEKKAWQQSEHDQAKLLLNILSDELKMPMVAVSKPEVDSLIRMFMHQAAGSSVFLSWANGDTESFGDKAIPADIERLSKLPVGAAAVPGQDKWYATGINYNAIHLASIAVKFPGKSWRENDLQIKLDLTITAAVIALFASLLVHSIPAFSNACFKSCTETCSNGRTMRKSPNWRWRDMPRQPPAPAPCNNRMHTVSA